MVDPAPSSTPPPAEGPGMRVRVHLRAKGTVLLSLLRDIAAPGRVAQPLCDSMSCSVKWGRQQHLPHRVTARERLMPVEHRAREHAPSLSPPPSRQPPGARFPAARVWRRPKCPTTDWRVQAPRNVSTMDYYSVMNTNDLLPLATVGMDLEGMMPSEICQTEKDKHPMISLTCGT